MEEAGCATYLTKFAARSPAPATISVCGLPCFFDARESLSGSSVNSSKKSGSFSVVLFSCHDVVSLMTLAAAHMSGHDPKNPKEDQPTRNSHIRDLNWAQVRTESRELLQEVIGEQLVVHA